MAKAPRLQQGGDTGSFRLTRSRGFSDFVLGVKSRKLEEVDIRKIGAPVPAGAVWIWDDGEPIAWDDGEEIAL